MLDTSPSKSSSNHRIPTYPRRPLVRQKRPLARCGKVILDWFYRHGFPASSAAKPDRSSPVAGDLQEHQSGANLADALEKAAAGKPHKLALVACRQPSLIVGRNGCPLIAQTLHGDGNAICWVTQAGARHEDASRVPPQPRPCPAASCARKICHVALAVAELPLKLALACSADDR